MTADSAQQYIKSATSETPLGLFQFDDKEKSIVIDGQFNSIDGLKNLEIPLSAASATSGNSDDQSNASASGQDAMAGTSVTNTSQSTKVPSVKLADIANVSIGDERKSISKTNGKNAVNVQVIKAQDANTVQVAKDTKKEIDKFVKANPELKDTKVMDTAKPIEDAINTMIEKAILGTILLSSLSYSS